MKNVSFSQNIPVDVRRRMEMIQKIFSKLYGINVSWTILKSVKVAH